MAATDRHNVELGPFFTAGVVLLAYGLLRRRPLVAAAGLGGIWLDQRTELGRSVKRRVRAMSVQVVEDDRDETLAEHPSRGAPSG
jgi:hypothetical protein